MCDICGLQWELVVVYIHGMMSQRRWYIYPQVVVYTQMLCVLKLPQHTGLLWCCDFRVEAKQWSRDQTLYFWGISVSVEAFSSKCSVSSVEKHTEFYFCAISCYMLLSLFSELLKSSSYENVWKNELSCHEWYM